MGFRFRKKIKLGIFNINLSKTGIGASVGVKGIRLTKMANGRTRQTLSLPNTGLSYVTETSGKKKQPKTSSMSKTQEYEWKDGNGNLLATSEVPSPYPTYFGLIITNSNFKEEFLGDLASCYIRMGQYTLLPNDNFIVWEYRTSDRKLLKETWFNQQQHIICEKFFDGRVA